VTDAVILASQLDGVLQVVRAGMTRIDLIQRCKVLLERADVHMLGPVLNGVQASDLGYYANYYYYGGYYPYGGYGDPYYGYGYGYPYGYSGYSSAYYPAYGYGYARAYPRYYAGHRPYWRHSYGMVRVHHYHHRRY